LHKTSFLRTTGVSVFVTLTIVTTIKKATGTSLTVWRRARKELAVVVWVPPHGRAIDTELGIFCANNRIGRLCIAFGLLEIQRVAEFERAGGRTAVAATATVVTAVKISKGTSFAASRRTRKELAVVFWVSSYRRTVNTELGIGCTNNGIRLGVTFGLFQSQRVTKLECAKR
jgi:hypothetical protein